MRQGIAVAALSAALVLGIAIGYVDSRPTWDDAGVTAGATLLAAAVLSAIAPRVAWLVALAIGLPIVTWNVVQTGNFGSAVVLIIAFVGAAVGFGVRRFTGTSAASTQAR